MNRHLGLLMGLTLGALGSTIGLAERPAVAGSTVDAARTVRVETAVEREHREIAVFHGLTRSSDRTAVSFTIPGRVVARPVEVGDAVKKGQVLARLDAKPLKNAKAAAKAELRRINVQLAQQQRTEARAQGLFDEGAVTVAQLEQAQSGAETLLAAKAAAEAQLAERGRQLTEAVVRAPFDAEVTSTFIEPGQVIAPGSPVVQLSGRTLHEVELAVPGRIADRLSIGYEVEVRYVDPEWEAVKGTVERVSLASQGAGALFTVVITLEDTDEAPIGLPVVLELPVAVHDRVSVPVAALVDPAGQQPHVWVADAGTVDKRPVELVGMVDGRVLLAAGVRPQEQVVVSGLAHLLPGDAVEIQEDGR